MALRHDRGSRVSALPAIERPNGKLYRPRYVRSQTLGNEDEVYGIVVFGTLDRALAESTANLDLAALLREWFGGDGTRESAAAAGGYDLVLHGEPKAVWWRRDFRGIYDDIAQYGYSTDEERGAFGYRWHVREVEVPPERPDGIMPPPLDGIEVPE